MSNFEIIEAKRWVNTDGRTASIYGSCPYVSDADKPNWSVQTVGYTLLNLNTGTVGIGRKPFATFEEATQFMTAH